MGNQVSDGKTLLFANAGSAIAAGAVVALGSLGYGVASVNIAASTGTGVVDVDGVHELAKTTSQTYVVGDKLWWDAANGKVTNVPAQHGFIGYAAAPAASAATKARVRLARFAEDGPRLVALAATGAQSLSALVFAGGRLVTAQIANTAGVALTLPVSTSVPNGSLLQVIKTGGGGFAVTVTPAAGGDTVNGTSSHASIDADNDEALYVLNGTDWRIVGSTIA